MNDLIVIVIISFGPSATEMDDRSSDRMFICCGVSSRFVHSGICIV